MTAIAVGAGALLATLLTPPPPKADAAAQKDGRRAQPGAANKDVRAAAASNLVDLPPIVTNIGTPTDIWARVEASIVIDGKTTAHPEILAARDRHRRTRVSENPVDRADRRADRPGEHPPGPRRPRLVRSNGKVSEFILKTLVLQ